MVVHAASSQIAVGMALPLPIPFASAIDKENMPFRLEHLDGRQVCERFFARFSFVRK
jgi:hypothetical protein